MRQLLVLMTLCGQLAISASPYASSEGGTYPELIALSDEFFAWRQESLDPLQRTATQVAAQIETLQTLQQRLNEISPTEWRRAQQVDYLALRSAMDQYDFLLHVSKPWERDPGYYIDRMLRTAFTKLPVTDDAKQALVERLQKTVALADAAQQNLQNVPKDFGFLAVQNLTVADGVGHGHPYRKVPPAGVIGWYGDLLEQAKLAQPELIEPVQTALKAVEGLHQWLLDRQPEMTAPAGIGAPLLDWYLRHVKYMPYSSEVIEALGERELERTWAFYALEQHRNRDLPPLSLPKSEDEYIERIAAVDKDIRAFLVEQEFISIPDHIPTDFREMGFNVPWINRPNGPNYWEQIQYRDPSPDHWHAVIPGHRFDARVLATNEHPIRKHFRDGGRMEGWALYLEEAPLQLGFYEDRPRTRELIYNFGIFRAARTIGDIRLQRNEVSIPEIIKFWRAKTPWLDEDVARVDAEIYLRRPPGYGLGYTVGSFQMYKLLADRKRQLGDDFVLQHLHDEVMSAGAIPLSLLRYEITGLDDEVSQYWEHQRLEDKLAELIE